MSKKLSVYILQCSDGSFYTGVTNNVARRVEDHNQGVASASYTASRLPAKLVFTQEFNSPIQAINLEKQIKGWRREKKIALIEGRFGDLPGLAKKAKK